MRDSGAVRLDGWRTASTTITGHTDVKELALYAQDTITKGPWSFNLGLRGDFYNGLEAVSRQAEPRAGVAYNIKKTNTVLRVSYARTMESPFNENLILSGTGCNDPVVNAIMTVAQGFACTTAPLTPGFRNEFHAGLQQAFGKYFVLSGEYIWKYTHNAYDFNVFGTTPITFPIEWHNSKIPGFAVRGSLPNFHGLTAFIVMSHVAARFFPPTVSGIAPPAAGRRVPHRPRRGIQPDDPPAISAVQAWAMARVQLAVRQRTRCWPDALLRRQLPAVHNAQTGQPAIDMVLNDGVTPLTADQEFEAGFTCNGVAATPTVPLPSTCLASQFGSTLIKVPAPGTENDDHNPPRSRRGACSTWRSATTTSTTATATSGALRFTVINLANKVALYNFLSTFSGTHYVTPRTETVELGFHF